MKFEPQIDPSRITRLDKLLPSLPHVVAKLVPICTERLKKEASHDLDKQRGTYLKQVEQQKRYVTANERIWKGVQWDEYGTGAAEHQISRDHILRITCIRTDTRSHLVATDRDDRNSYDLNPDQLEAILRAIANEPPHAPDTYHRIRELLQPLPGCQLFYDYLLYLAKDSIRATPATKPAPIPDAP